MKAKVESFQFEGKIYSGSVGVRFGTFYVGGNGLFPVSFIDIDNLTRPMTKMCFVRLSNQQQAEAIFASQAEAESFYDQLRAEQPDRRKAKKQRTGDVQRQPAVEAPDSLESVPSPPRIPARRASGAHVIADPLVFTNRNCLPSIGARADTSSRSSYSHDTTPKPNFPRTSGSPVRTSHHFDGKTASPTELESQKRRRNIDARVDTGPTPEKATRTAWIPRRAQYSRAPMLTVDRSVATVTPQKSSQYQQYRFQETFGLRNLGNTCYLNAVMQALHSLAEFVAALRILPQKIPTAAQGDLFQCTIDILGQMSSPAALSGPLSPAKLRERIASVSPAFRGNGQQDAHEFFLEYVNQLHDELYVARSALAGDDTSPEDLVLTTQQFFDSQVQKSLCCMECDHSREVRELFRDFSLDMNDIASGSCLLTDMLKAYFAPEELELKCEKCDCRQARMDSVLAAPPRVLVLHLKRFVPNVAQSRYDKFHQHVEFPVTLDLRAALQGTDAHASSTAAKALEQVAASPLRSPDGRLPARPLAAEAGKASSNPDATAPQQQEDMERKRLPPLPPPADAPPHEQASFAAQPAQQLLYDLRSVVSHEGSSPHSGHYVCYAKREGSSTWACFNDALVEDLPHMKDPQSQLGRKAYMLFYVQRQ
mmetsp:Transcript_11740/g.21361  ORF Transcript_11740/g.21361 Transcript_11740/m.21361 type:complete len:651 (+) Transcript_11740:88-2040(+)